MPYLYIYLAVGFILVLWDFRKYMKLAFWRIRFWRVEEYAAIISHGPKPQVDWWNMPKYIRNKNYFVAILFVIFWPIKLLFFTPKFNGLIRNIRAGRSTLFFGRKENGRKVYSRRNEGVRKHR